MITDNTIINNTKNKSNSHKKEKIHHFKKNPSIGGIPPMLKSPKIRKNFSLTLPVKLKFKPSYLDKIIITLKIINI